MAIPSGVAYSGLFKSYSSENALVRKLFPAIATRLLSISRAAVRPSFSPASLLPPPARNRAEGALPFTSRIFPAISLQRDSDVPWMQRKISSLEAFLSNPRISVKVISSSFSICAFIFSAVMKSTRNSFIMDSVISSPAIVAIVYPVTLPLVQAAISEVPAPISTITRFKSLRFSGIAALMAAIGSNVMLATSRPILFIVVYRLSTTSLGRNVAIRSTLICFPRWSFKLEIIYWSR